MTVQRTLTFIVCLLANAFLHAQDRSTAKFGKISPADFDIKAPSFDTAADAVVIADVGYSDFVGNPNGWFTLQYRHFKRIKILNKNAFSTATVKIPLYFSGTTSEKLESLKANTYNLENGKVVETKLDDKSIFTDKTSSNWMEKKFTFPALKEGSIIEYSYIQESPYFEFLQPWYFQDVYPCLYSEYEVNLPQFFQYVTLTQGYLPFQKTSSVKNVTFHLTIPGGASKSESMPYDDDVTDTKYTMKNIPSFKLEKYTTTPANYMSKIEFQLARYTFRDMMVEDRMGSWKTLAQDLMKYDRFGSDLNSNNSWMNDELETVTKGAATSMEKAKKIYAYVRDNFTCTSHNELEGSNNIKTVFKNRNGNEAELNLLLVAMLKHEHFQALPVILSTRSHGFTNELYPLLSRFNYTIAAVSIDSAAWFLDASEPWIGFGHLPERCYNGHARIIVPDDALPVYFDADSLMDKSMTTVFFTNDEKGNYIGRVQSTKGIFESSNIRERVHDKGDKEFFKDIQMGIPQELEMSGPSIDSLKILDLPVAVNYDLKLKVAGEDIIYFNPMLAEGYKENPFKAAERLYPVEMPYGSDETYVLNMETPQGYVIDEIPKSTKVTFNGDEGFFEYLIVKDDNGIQFKCRIQLKRANFKPEDYATLRDFFAFIVKKQSEQIVFKKKK